MEWDSLRMLETTGEVTLPPGQRARWEVKIGADRAGANEKPGVGIGKWLANPGGVQKIMNNSSFTT